MNYFQSATILIFKLLFITKNLFVPVCIPGGYITPVCTLPQCAYYPGRYYRIPLRVTTQAEAPHIVLSKDYNMKDSVQSLLLIIHNTTKIK